jgi:hypothetical protein
MEGVLSPLLRTALEKAGAIPVERPKAPEQLVLEQQQGIGLVGALEGAGGEGDGGEGDVVPAAEAAVVKQEEQQGQQVVVKKEPSEPGSAGRRRSSSRQVEKQKALEAAVMHRVKKERVSDDEGNSDDSSSSSSDDDDDDVRKQQQQQRDGHAKEQRKRQKVYDLVKQEVVRKHEFEDFIASSSASSSDEEDARDDGEEENADAAAASRKLMKRRLEAAVGGLGSGGHKGRPPEKKLRLTPRNAKKEAALGLVKREGSGEEESAAAPVEERAAPSRPTEMITVDVKVYEENIGTKDVFDSDLQRWYGERNLSVAQPIVGGFTWDMYTIFKLVAKRGGSEAATHRRAWRAIAREWHQELDTAKNIGSIMRQNYKKTLLDFENYFTKGAMTRQAVFTRELAVGKSIVQRAAAGGTAAGKGDLGTSSGRQRVALGSAAGGSGGGSGSGGVLKRQGGSGDIGDERQRIGRPRMGGEERGREGAVSLNFQNRLHSALSCGNGTIELQTHADLVVRLGSIIIS